METDDRRRHTRYPVAARVKLFSANFGSISGVTSNIADGGIFVRLDSPGQTREGSSIKLVMLDSKNPDIIFNTRVIRVEKEGWALEILSFERNGQVSDIGQLRKAWQQGD